MRKFRLKAIGVLKFHQKPAKVEKEFQWGAFFKSLPVSILAGIIILVIMALVFIIDWLLSPTRRLKE